MLQDYFECACHFYCEVNAQHNLLNPIYAAVCSAQGACYLRYSTNMVLLAPNISLCRELSAARCTFMAAGSKIAGVKIK